MANFFDKVQQNAKQVEEELIGPDYKYFKYVKSPEEMGMSSDGSLGTLASDIGGLIGYVELLAVGGGKASKVAGPLGNKFFLTTGAKCVDVDSGNQVTRSIYINNVPDGSIPFITSALDGQKMTEFEGLIPGTMSNLAHINPMQIFQAFMSGSNPNCQAVEMETIDVNNIKSNKTAFVTIDDINSMDKDWFPNGTKPTIRTPPQKEKFTTLGSASSASIDYSKIPDDIFVKLYFSALGLLGIYIFLKMFQKKID
jgi:hypothetical protein